MKLRFEPDLEFQLEAVEAACDLFRGQEVCRTEFTVTRDAGGLAFEETGLGISNRQVLLLSRLRAFIRPFAWHGPCRADSADSVCGIGATLRPRLVPLRHPAFHGQRRRAPLLRDRGRRQRLEPACISYEPEAWIIPCGKNRGSSGHIRRTLPEREGCRAWKPAR